MVKIIFCNAQKQTKYVKMHFPLNGSSNFLNSGLAYYDDIHGNVPKIPYQRITLNMKFNSSLGITNQNASKTRQESSLIHSARPTVPAGSDGRLILKFWDVRTDTLCEYSDHYWLGLWSASWINSSSSLNSYKNCVRFLQFVTQLKTKKRSKSKYFCPKYTLGITFSCLIHFLVL